LQINSCSSHEGTSAKENVMLGPEIRGNLVTLKSRNAEDYAMTFIRHFQDPEVTKFLGSNRSVPTIEEEVSYLDEASRDSTSIHWAIHYEGNCIGSISIENIHWMLRTCEVGLFIGESRLWGKGLAKDALRNVLDFAFGEYAFEYISAVYFDGNYGSEALQTSLGFEEAGRLHNGHFSEGEMRDHVTMELSRERWIELNQ
jgi:RimJ/RimL family protein N-acetyltransferase